MISVFRIVIFIIILQDVYHSGFKAGIEYSRPDALTAADMVPAPRTSYAGAIDYFPPSEGNSP